MTTNQPDSFVTVYSTPLEFDAGLVKAMLAEQDIPSSVENANGPFPGITVIPCEVSVPAEFEERARELVAEHEERLRQRADGEFTAEEEEEEEEAELDDLDEA